MKSKYYIYNASAGSGKTYTLVLNYLKLALDNPTENFKKILAITFTKKAVFEMKSRILSSLFQLSKNPISSIYMNDIKKELNISTEIIKKKAKNTLISILHNYSFFSIYTIDKFYVKLINSFSKELNIPKSHLLIINSDYYIQKSIDEFICKIENNTNNKTITKIICNEYNNNPNKKKIKLNLIENLKDLIQEKNYYYNNFYKKNKINDFIKLQLLIKYRKKKIFHKMMSISLKVLDIINTNNLNHKDFLGGKYSFKGYFEKIINHLLNNDLKSIINQSFFTIKKNIKNKFIIRKNFKNEYLLNLITNSLINLFNFYHKLLEEYIIDVKIYKALIILILKFKFKKILNNIKNNEEVIFLSDINLIIHENLNKETIEYIYEKIGIEYKYFFFDEFQDTSELQWKIFFPFFNHAISKNKSFITLLGDIKQSIYRFRGASPEIFINEINNQTEKNKEIIDLPNNFRSKSNIINFNNKIYTTIFNLIKEEKYKKLYQYAYQNPNHKKGGTVQVAYFDLDGYEIKTHNHILNIIINLKSIGKSLNEIVILLHNNKLIKNLSNFLLDHNIPVFTDDVLLLNNILCINILCNLIKWLNNTTNDENLLFNFLIDLEYEKKKTTKEEFSKFFIRIKSLNLIEINKEINIRYNINLNINFKEYVNISHLIEYLIFSLKLNINYQLYFSAILNIISEKESLYGMSIYKFIHYFDYNKEKIKYQIPKKNNAIQIMTIHKAKGLEFPIVIYPNFVNNHIKNKFWIKLNPKKYYGLKYFYLYLNKNEQKKVFNLKNQFDKLDENINIDEININYVATTRAKEALYLIFPKKNNKTNLVLGKHIQDIFKLNLEKSIFNLFDSKIEIIKLKTLKKNKFNWISDPHNLNIFFNKYLKSPFLDLNNNKNYGEFIHNLLSKIETNNDFDKLYLEEKNNNLIPNYDIENIFLILKKIIFHKKIKIYFTSNNNHQIYNEREIVFNSLIYRPDKMISINGNFTIIDYKIGKFYKKYLEQMKHYEQALNSINYKVENKFLVMINSSVEVITI